MKTSQKTLLVIISALLLLVIVPPARAFTPTLCWSFDDDVANPVESCYGNNQYVLKNVTSDYTASGKFGGARDYEQTNSDQDEVNSSGSLTLSSNKMALGAWVKTESFDASNNRDIFIKQGTQLYTIGQNIVGENNKYVSRITGAAGAFADINPNTSQWYHIVVVYDNAIHYIYVDGQLRGTQAQAAYAPGNQLNDIKFGGQGAGTYWDGIVDEAFFYDGNMTAAEVLEVYQRTSSWSAAANPTSNAGFIESASRGNLTVRESSLQNFNLSILFNTTAVADINATFTIDGLNTLVVDGTIINDSVYNRTTFNVTMGIPLTQSNGSSRTWNWTYTVGWKNGSRVTYNVTNNASTVLWSYFWNPNLTLVDWTVYETNTTLFIYNLTKLENTATFATPNSTWNGTLQTLTANIASATSNSYNDTRTSPLVLVNRSANYFNSSIVVTFNGTSYTRNSSLWNQTVLYAYFITNHTLLPANAVEDRYIYMNATLTKLVTGATVQINFTHNNTNYAGTQAVNSSSSEVWNAAFIIPALNPNNQTVGNNITLNLYFNGTWIQRTNTTHAPSILQTQWKMVLTDCSAGSASTSVAYNYTLNAQDNVDVLVATVSTDQHIVYGLNTFNRTYGFTRTAKNNWTICIYPYFAGSEYNDRSSVQVGDAITFAVQSVINTTTINLTQHNVRFFAANLSETGMTLTTISVEDSRSVAQESVWVEVYRYYLATNTNLKVYEAQTNSAGQLKTYLRLNDQYYNFKVFDSTHMHLLHSTDNQYIFTNTYTIKIGVGVLKGWDLYYALNSAFRTLTYDNSTFKFSLYYDFTNTSVGNFTINQVCLQLQRGNNRTINDWTEYQTTCSASQATTLTTNALDLTITDDWRAVAYANITASPANQYILETLSIGLGSDLGVEGVFWGLMLIIAMVSGAFFNPVVAVAIGTLTATFLAILGVMSGWAAASVFIVGAVVIYAIRG